MKKQEKTKKTVDDLYDETAQVITSGRRGREYFPQDYTIISAVMDANANYVKHHIKFMEDIEHMKLLRMIGLDWQKQLNETKPGFLSVWGRMSASVLSFGIPIGLFYLCQFSMDVGRFYYLLLIPALPAFLLSAPLTIMLFQVNYVRLKNRYRKMMRINDHYDVISLIEKRIKSLGGRYDEPLRGLFESSENYMTIRDNIKADEEEMTKNEKAQVSL